MCCEHAYVTLQLYTVDTSIINRKLFEQLQLYISGRGRGGVYNGRLRNQLHAAIIVVL